MCGIAGVFNYRSGKPVDEAVIDRMLACIAHRGPDSRGTHVDGEFGFGMVRLAIIGGPEADQPMWSIDRTLALICNGEIYNYRDLAEALGLRTTSDTLVLAELLARRGPDALPMAAGMFAGAAFDPRRRLLTLFRDRFGKKPLFVATTRDGVAFASELKPLLLVDGVDRSLDSRGIGAFLNLTYVPPPLSPIRAIRPLAAASFATFGAVTHERVYWEPRASGVSHDPAAEFEDRFDVAVRRRLVSDVPIGIFLSGGLDSNAVLASALRLQPGSIVRAYTIAPDTGESEAHLARRTCRHFGIPLEEVEITARTVIENFERIVETADGLIANPPMFALDALAAAASRDLKVVLSGAGGDELFYGYPTWRADWLFRAWRLLPGVVRTAARHGVRLLPVDYSSHALSYALDKLVTAPGRSRRVAHAWWRTVLAGAELQALNPTLRDEWANVYDDAYRFADRYAAGFERTTALADLRVWWQGMGLYLADAVPMGHGVEVRSPFMDHDLYDWTLGVPLRTLHHPLRSKPFLRHMLRHRVPEWVVRSPKKPFHIPLAQWLRGPLADLVGDHLQADTLRAQGLLDAGAVQRIVQEHREGVRDNSFKILALLVLTVWYRRVYAAYVPA